MTEQPHEHEWTWHHDWWGAHVCDCGAVQESPPHIEAQARPPVASEGLRAALALWMATYLPVQGYPAGYRIPARGFDELRAVAAYREAGK